MKRNFLSLLLVVVFGFISVNVFAFGSVFPVSAKIKSMASCPVSPNHAASNFCDNDVHGSGYRAVVYCYCHNQVPLPSCQSMEWVYEMMINRYGSLEKGCENNPAGTNVHECMNQWSCYMTGKPEFSGDPACVDSKPMCG